MQGLPPGARVTTVAELTARINDHMRRGEPPRTAFLAACKELDLHFPEERVELAVRALEAEHDRQMTTIDSGGGVLANGLVVQPVHPDDARAIAEKADATLRPKIIA